MRHLAAMLVLVSIFLGCHPGEEDRATAFALVNARLEACDEHVRWLLAVWPDIPSPDSDSVVTLEYLALNARQLTRPGVLEAPTRDSMAIVASQSGEQRDLLMALYGDVESLCSLGANPYGLNKLTVMSQLGELRKKIEGTKSSLRLLLQVPDARAKAILEPIEVAAESAQMTLAKQLAERVTALEAKAAAAQEVSERRAREQETANLEARQLQIQAEAMAVQAKRAEQESQLEEAAAARKKLRDARAAEERERLARLQSMKPRVEPWFLLHHGSLTQFAAMAKRISLQLADTPIEKYPKRSCQEVLAAIQNARNMGVSTSGSAEVDEKVEKVLAAGELMARACVGSSPLVTAGVGSDQAMRDLNHLLRLIGFDV